MRDDPIIIIGAHRSGTTFLSGILNDSGIFMGNDLTAYNESSFFQKFNVKLLRSNNYTWDNPGVPSDYRDAKFNRLSFVRNYTGTTLRRLYRCPGNIIAFFNFIANGSWGWKDPRNTFTLDYWLELFPQAKVLHIYRNGMDVAISLYVRNKKRSKDNIFYSKILENKLEGLNLWEKYYNQAESYTPILKKRMLTIRFEKVIMNDSEEISRIEEFLGIALNDKIEKRADSSRTKRYESGAHQDLIEYAKKSILMKRLGYA